MVSLQRKIIFDIHVDPNWAKWQTKSSKLAAKDFETSEFHQDMWKCYLRLGFVLPHDPWNAISNLELQLSYKELRDHLVQPSASTLSSIYLREYALTVDAMEKQLPSPNEVRLALDGCTSPNILAISSVDAYYMDHS